MSYGFGRRFGLLLVAALLWLFVMQGMALAEDAIIGVGAPGSVAVGDEVEVKAIVTSDGLPLEGAVVSLTYEAVFAGESGRVELDRQTTDSAGIALLSYQQRAAQNGEMQVAYVGPDEIQAIPVSFDIAVQLGGQQQHRSEAGVSIPWLTGWVVIVIIMIVWGLIVFSALQLVLVGRGRIEEPNERLASETVSDVGSTWLSVVFAIVTIVTAVGMVIVFVRNPLTHNNIDTPERYDRTPVAYVGEEYPYTGMGIADPSLTQTGDAAADGRFVYFAVGCSACHFVDGSGGIVGPELVGETGSLGGFTEDIREGPKGMPAYSSEALSDEKIAQIHAFLKSSEES